MQIWSRKDGKVKVYYRVCIEALWKKLFTTLFASDKWT